MRAILPDFQESRIEKRRFDHIGKDITSDDVTKTLNEFNPEFVQSFAATGLPQELLVEFVYAVNHLDNLTEMFNFPTDRLITTPDIINFGPEACKALASDQMLGPGADVNEEILDRVQEFFNMKYVKTIHMVLEKFGTKGITFYLNGFKTFVGITYKTNHARFGILSYRVFDSKDGNPGTHIPFLINRLR